MCRLPASHVSLPPEAGLRNQATPALWTWACELGASQQGTELQCQLPPEACLRNHVLWLKVPATATGTTVGGVVAVFMV